MFKLIKWILILLVVCWGWYLANFFWSMDSNIKDQVKQEAIEAIESGDANVLVEPLSIKVKDDLLHKKADFIETIKAKLKAAVDRLFD